MTPDEPGRARVVAAIQELRRKLAAGEDTGSLTIPDPSRRERFWLWLQQRWGARRYRHKIGADLPIRERRRRALNGRRGVSDFYEDDEPVEEIAAAFEAGLRPYWVEDESLSREETLARFYALKPEPTVGPKTMTHGETTSLSWPPESEPSS